MARRMPILIAALVALLLGLLTGCARSGQQQDAQQQSQKTNALPLIVRCHFGDGETDHDDLVLVTVSASGTRLTTRTATQIPEQTLNSLTVRVTAARGASHQGASK